MLTTELVGSAALVLSTVAGGCHGGAANVEMVLEWQARSVPAPLRDIAMDEVEAIWGRLGVTVRWIPSGDSRAVVVRAIVTDDVSQNGAGAALPHLGWIEFWGDKPSNVVRVSASAALDAARDARMQGRLSNGQPLAALRMNAARLIGRAIAHELGHYLLQSRRHTPNGLMRSVFPAYEAMLPRLDRYRLERQQLAALQGSGRDRACR